jgi:hypothetical protein
MFRDELELAPKRCAERVLGRLGDDAAGSFSNADRRERRAPDAIRTQPLAPWVHGCRRRRLTEGGYTLRFSSIPIAALTLTLCSPQAAAASPGQTVAQFQSWAKANPALHALSKQQVNQDTGQPFYTATFQAGLTPGTFLANIGSDGKVTDESVEVDTTVEAYDILKHLDTAAAMVEAVYGPDVAKDFKTATRVGQWALKGRTHATALSRGTIYGYETTYHFVQLIPASRIDAEAKRLVSCAAAECDDD